MAMPLSAAGITKACGLKVMLDCRVKRSRRVRVLVDWEWEDGGKVERESEESGALGRGVAR